MKPCKKSPIVKAIVRVRPNRKVILKAQPDRNAVIEKDPIVMGAVRRKVLVRQ